MSSHFARLLSRQLTRVNASQAVWAFPLAVTGGWLIWPALDMEWKVSMGLATDPEAGVQAVQAAKARRLEAFNMAHGIVAPSAVAAMEEDEEEEEGEPDEETAVEEEEQEEEAPPAEKEDEGEEEEEEEEEEERIKIKPLLTPAKGDKLSVFEMWDNFTIKSVKMTDEDDDDDDDEDEDEDDDE